MDRMNIVAKFAEIFLSEMRGDNLLPKYFMLS